MTMPRDRRGARSSLLWSALRAVSAATGTVAIIAGLGLIPAGARAAGPPDHPRIAPDQEIVSVFATHPVRASPGPGGPVVAWVRSTRPITGGRTVLPVIGQIVGARGRSWLHVRLPGRVLGAEAPPRTGWISASYTLRSTTRWHLVVDTAARRLIVYHDGRRLHRYRAIVGKPSTPTPPGEYFVEENVQLPASRPGAPFALATSARSTVFQEFEGGPGQIAVHGRANLGGQLGTAVSHGCIRLADDVIAALASRLTPGTPVTVL